MRAIGIIPARMASTRFPGKPLAPLCGIPMLGHVYHRSRMCEELDALYVATCDKEIVEYVESIGGEAVMTADTHERCGDRVAEALLTIESGGRPKPDVVVLIQGDEPLVRPEMIRESLAPLRDNPSVRIVNLMGDIESEDAWRDPNEVKVVVDPRGFAVYFSREPIPSKKKWAGDIPMKKQICIIPHRRDFLLEFTGLEPTPLEKIESVDMMRVIEHGYKVKMVQTAYRVQSVDTPADLADAEKIMAQDPLLPSYS
ncbi:MAG: 3-deoxy-manno-octulosonate cytidylyltransferase [Chitinivibrionales bacterium]|nr:3-deoxy-manno-octulosonate cytidylyltransferase [Chitinivibrionales bacterium]MBD3396066.1 3-deoxy-manno-octulosonate cytidylyltransferase [Chitinivibrionales bacterium]